MQKKIQDFTLGMIEMKQQNSGVNLHQQVMNLLSLYNINILQIYSCTSDNGKNMIKLGKIKYICIYFLICILKITYNSRGTYGNLSARLPTGSS